MKARELIDFFALFGALPAIGAASLLASEKIGRMYGHAFTEMGPSSASFLGTLGAVHNLASMILTAILNSQMDRKNEHPYVIFILGQTLTGTMLFGITALAAKINLLSPRLTYFGGALLIANGTISSFALFASVDWLSNKLDPVP